MSVPHRFFRRSVFGLLCMLPGVCAAQAFQQFQNVPVVQLTGGPVSSFLTGFFQSPPGGTDIFYINAPTVSGGVSSVTAGEFLNMGGGGLYKFDQDKIIFTNVSNVVATLTDFDGDGNLDYALALTPSGSVTTNLCVYYGTGTNIASSLLSVTASSYNGAASTPNEYPPTGGKSGCMTFAVSGSRPPNFSQIVAFPFKSSLSVQNLLIEDSANNLLYILQGTGLPSVGGVLASSFTLIHTISLPPADGAGPIYTGDFNGDGNADFIINGQTGNSASVYLGNGDGTFQPPIRYVFDHNVHSMLLHDMNRDGIQDMVVEGDKGVIEIFPGTGRTANLFSIPSIGGASGGDGFSGHGGHLAAINPTTLDILTTTPIGLSLLQGSGSRSYILKGIYNIGPGRSAYALADFYNTGRLDLAADSPEGIPIFRADTNGDGGFQTSNAYAALAPGLGSVVGLFRNAANNPGGNLDVAVATSATHVQLLTGNGDGTFVPAGSGTGSPGANSPWSNIASGDFNGDGNLDIAYSWTGLPVPAGSPAADGLYVQYGNGDGTFSAPTITLSQSFSSLDYLYGESAVGDFNGDGIADIANGDLAFDDTLLGGTSNSFLVGLQASASNTVFNQVAAGFFKANRASQQDLIFQQGPNFIPYKNAQDKTGKNFTAMTPITNGASPPLYPSNVLFTDVDGDGYGDLVVVYYNANYNPVGAGPVAPNDLYIWYGNGDGTFSATPQVMTLSRNDYLGIAADMNGDGLPDLVLSDGSLVTILYNQGGSGTPVNRTFGGEQRFLAGQGINSISTLVLPGNGLPGLVVANGGATISNALALGGGTASSLSLTPNPDVNTGGITVLVNNITTLPVTATLSALPEPSSYGATFTLTATITPLSGTTVPQGVVTFSIDGGPAPCSPDSLTPVGGISLSAQAICVVPAGNIYPGGVHTLGAAYSGSSVYTAITFAGTHTIVGGTTTTTIYLCVGPTPSCPSTGYVMPPFASSLTMYYGQTWNGTWQITSTGLGALTGDFQLYDLYGGASSLLCDVPSSGASCPSAVGVTVGTAVGINVLTGVYTGDSAHTSSTSSPVTITVRQDTTGSAALTGSPNPSPSGQPVTFTATLTGNFAAPMGTVTFSQVNPGGSTTTLGTGTFTPGSGFTSTATFTTSSLPVGSDSITASYAGTTDFAAATFPTFIETVTPSLAGNFTLTATPNPVTVGVGLGGILTVTVTPQNGFSQGVNLTCSNLPNEVSCIFVNASIAAGGGTTTLIVQTTAPHTCGTTTPYFYGRLGKGPPAAPFTLPVLAGLVLLFVPGKRRWMRSLIAVAVVAAITQISGCGTCTDLGTRPATYTFQVTATAANSPTTQSQVVTMNVTI